MRGLVIFCAVLAVPILAAQDGYKYREPAPVIEKGNLPTQPKPCTHGFTGYNFDEATKALIKAQTQARIVNKAQASAGAAAGEHNLETAASGYSQQIGVANQVASSSFQSQTNKFVAGQGYTQGGGVSSSGPSVNYIPLSPVSHGPPQSLPLTQIPPPLSAHGHTISSGAGTGHSHTISSGAGSGVGHSHSFSSSASQQQFVSGANQHSQGYNYQQGNGGVQQLHGSQSFPPPQYKPLPSGLTAPGFIGGAQQSSNFLGGQQQIAGHYITQTSGNFNGQQHGGQFAGHSASGNIGSSLGSHASSGNFAGGLATHFGGQQQFSGSHSSAGNFAGGHSASFGGQQHFSASGSDLSGNFVSHLQGGSAQGSSQLLSTFSSSNLGANGLNGQLGNVIRETVAQAPLDPTAEKHIYVHIPPEDLEGDQQQSLIAPQFVAPPAKKHYKIVFIKAPTHNTPNYSQLAAAAAPKVEEKTLIYVLTKKPEEPSLEQIQQLTQDNYKSSKPEVYFIKYKTQKEGDAVQQYLANSNGISPDQIDFSNLIDNSGSAGGIDIRAGGLSSGASSSSSTSSFSTSSSSISSSSSNLESEGPKHELYGVPLQ
ncbi:GATA zinc finger domain-containing protein 7-like [Musca domestica]|uniref:GATA zinc finger domain-containing protein 7-like n=1 Tax=Musca domestica TaxID=7370 RepID=A0A1I8N242_MUSDO|nr:GATA zinc finger domain-containing protein 7-like [Musca domestica]